MSGKKASTVNSPDRFAELQGAALEAFKYFCEDQIRGEISGFEMGGYGSENASWFEHALRTARVT